MNALNERILADVSDLRDVAPIPEERNYTLLARAEHIRVKFDDGVSFAFTTIYGDIESRGYHFVGINFESKEVVFAHEESDQ